MIQKPLDTSDMLESADDFETAYQSHAPAIQRFLYWRTQSTELSEDLTSNVFEKAWRSRMSFRGGSVQAWLHQIARNVLVDYWRKKHDVSVENVEALAMIDETQSMGELLDQAQQAANLQQAVDKLPHEMRQVVVARFMEGLSCRQTAQRLQLSESNVRVIQYRALKKLKGYLQ